jgi:hypothetical protein
VLRRPLAFIALILGMLIMPAVTSARPIAFGVHTPKDPFGGNTKKIDGLQRDTGRPIDVVSWFQSWGGAPWIAQVQPHVFKAVIDSGRSPLVAWEPWKPGGGAEQPDYSLARIAGGAFDAYITKFARSLRDLHATVYLRPMHEMNGNWYPWSGTVNGNSPERYVEAWRHIVDIFRKQSANNVKWVFTPLNEDWPITSENTLESYYPGSKYVDVLAVDGYNWGASKPDFGGWRTFTTTFAHAYERLAQLGSQPIWIAEVGSATVGGSKADWVRDMFKSAQAMDRLNVIVWMDTIDPREGDWRIRSSADVLAAFRPDDGTIVASALARPKKRAGGAHADADGQARRDARFLRISEPVRVGRQAVVRWDATQDAVESWRVYLNDKRVLTLRAGASRVMRRRMKRPGRYRWTVRGFDDRGKTLVSASRMFRVVRRR